MGYLTRESILGIVSIILFTPMYRAQERLTITVSPPTFIASEGTDFTSTCVVSSPPQSLIMLVNKTVLSSPNIIERRINRTALSFTLSKVTAAYNNTSFLCQAIVGSNVSYSSFQTLLVQGILSPPTQLSAVIDDRITTIFWKPPFTLDITNEDPDVEYRICLHLSEVTTGNASCVIAVMTQFSNHKFLDLCELSNTPILISVTALNVVGESRPIDITYKHCDVPQHVLVYRRHKVIIREVTILGFAAVVMVTVSICVCFYCRKKLPRQPDAASTSTLDGFKNGISKNEHVIDHGASQPKTLTTSTQTEQLSDFETHPLNRKQKTDSDKKDILIQKQESLSDFDVGIARLLKERDVEKQDNNSELDYTCSVTHPFIQKQEAEFENNITDPLILKQENDSNLDCSITHEKQKIDSKTDHEVQKQEIDSGTDHGMKLFWKKESNSHKSITHPSIQKQETDCKTDHKMTDQILDYDSTVRPSIQTLSDSESSFSTVHGKQETDSKTHHKMTYRMPDFDSTVHRRPRIQTQSDSESSISTIQTFSDADQIQNITRPLSHKFRDYSIKGLFQSAQNHSHDTITVRPRSEGGRSMSSQNSMNQQRRTSATINIMVEPAERRHSTGNVAVLNVGESSILNVGERHRRSSFDSYSNPRSTPTHSHLSSPTQQENFDIGPVRRSINSYQDEEAGLLPETPLSSRSISAPPGEPY